MEVNSIKLLENLEKNINSYLVPPKLKISVKRKLIKCWEEVGLSSHAFITSSGTTSFGLIKSFALSYKALKENANAVNNLIGASKGDRWISSLPIYHVGGLSIFVRAHLSQSTVIKYNEKWNPSTFVKKVIKEKVQFCSLVPTQLFDIVQNNIPSPSCLKAVFVGGDFASDILIDKARMLNWPIYITYGMTEVCSQLASCKVEDYHDRFLPVLPIHKVKVSNGRLYVSSKSLFTSSFIMDDNSFKKIEPTYLDNYYETSDRCELIEDKYIRPLGRIGSEIKINGRLIDFIEIKNKFAQICDSEGVLNQLELVVVEDDRSGKIVEIWAESKIKDKTQIIANLLKNNYIILVSNIRYFEKLPRNHLGKLILHL